MGIGVQLTGVWSLDKNPVPSKVNIVSVPPDLAMFIGVTIVKNTPNGVGDGVGSEVGDGVGDGVGSGVGDGVGSGVGDGVGLRTQPACPARSFIICKIMRRVASV